MAFSQSLLRRKSRNNAFASDSSEQEAHADSTSKNLSKIHLVHKAEVYTSVENGSASSENNLAVEKRKKRLRRKATFSISKKIDLKSEESSKTVTDKESNITNVQNETFSEHSSSPSSDKVKLIPLLDSKTKKKPSGYATETLSEESDKDQVKMKPKIFPRSIELIGKSEKNNSSEDEILSTCDSNINHEQSLPAKEEMENGDFLSDLNDSFPHPIPVPRKLINKSVESFSEENIKVIHGSPKSYCTSSSLDYKDTGSLPKQRLKKSRRKKKSKDSNLEDSDQEPKQDITSLISANLLSSEELPVQKSSNFICITIEKCEPLQIKDFKAKPFVKIMILDAENGKPKLNLNRESIEPVATQPYDYTFQRSSTPHWNEDLIIMEHLDIIQDSKTILVIGILDIEKNKTIAWGFLKPLAANGASNIGKILRLQLFKPGKSSKDDLMSQIFTWWKNGNCKNYKSTLYLTVNGIPEQMIVKNKVGCTESLMAEQQSPEKSINRENLEGEDTDLENVKWGRLPSLSCKLPNKYLARLSAGPDGSIAIAYSHSGLLLASANKVSVSIYTFKGRPYLILRGHHGLVYSLKWSFNDKYLLSTSADFSACVWDISKKNSSPIQTFPHPSYVYSCAWIDNHTFSTGCFDNDIRIWKVGSDNLYQQASHHKGQINTLIFYDSFLMSGDSLGEICIWQWNPGGKLEYKKNLVVREIKGKVINKLSLHPGKKRLLVHTRDSVLRMIDLSSGSVLHWFQGSVNIKLREDSTFCGCGSSVLAWSEDSTLCVWDSNTGAQTAIYPDLISEAQPGVIDFHPRDHMMAVSAHSPQSPVLFILTYNRLSNGREVGLVPLNEGVPSLTLRSIRSSGHSSDMSSESTPKKKSLLKTLLGNRKRVKRETPNPTSMEHSFTDFSRISSGTSRHFDENEPVETIHKEGRLGDIIKRMDKILVAVSNNSSLYTS